MACVRDSKTSMAEAESRVLELLEKHACPGECPLTGKSVHVYQPFLKTYMPHLANYLCPDSIVDITTTRTLSWKWCPDDVRAFARKDRIFRSLDDILEDIRELQHFYRTVFRSRREDTGVIMDMIVSGGSSVYKEHPVFQEMVSSGGNSFFLW